MRDSLINAEISLWGYLNCMIIKCFVNTLIEILNLIMVLICISSVFLVKEEIINYFGILIKHASLATNKLKSYPQIIWRTVH